MTNTVYTEYRKGESTGNLLLGFTMSGEGSEKATDKVLACFVRDGMEVIKDMLVESVSSTGCYKVGTASKLLKFRPNKTQKLEIIARAEKVIEICTFAELKERAKIGRSNNKGKAFEIIAIETLQAKAATKQNATYQESGDFEYNGEQWQAKYNKASFKAIGID